MILTSASDKLYKELRQGCVKVFKMPESCYDETTTSDDDDATVLANNNNGKFDNLEDSSYIHDGVMLVGFQKGWMEKEKVEKKYEDFFCKALMEFYVENDVELDWTLVDGPPSVVEEEVVVEEGNSTMIELDTFTNSTAEDTFNNTDIDVDSNNTDVVDWSAIADLAAEAEADNVTTTTTSTTTASTTTTAPEAVQEEEEEDSVAFNTTAFGINAADTSSVQAVSQQQSDSSSTSLDKIPLGGWIGIGLGGVLFVFLIAALIVSKKRRRNANAADNIDDNDSIWSEDYEVTNMMTGAGNGSSSPMSGVAAIGMASTVATRLTTGDTEVALMKKQLWTEKEPVV